MLAIMEKKKEESLVRNLEGVGFICLGSVLPGISYSWLETFTRHGFAKQRLSGPAGEEGRKKDWRGQKKEDGLVHLSGLTCTLC